jgi:hypothetical protein
VRRRRFGVGMDLGTGMALGAYRYKIGTA